MIALVFSFRSYAGHIAAGTGFGDSDGQNVFAGDAFRQPACFLLFGAELANIRAAS